MSINQRIIKETKKLESDPIVGIYAIPVPENPRYFNVSIS
jgi:ubiquitin-protein ligase